MGNINAVRDWGHAKDFVEVTSFSCEYPFVEPLDHFISIVSYYLHVVKEFDRYLMIIFRRCG